MICTSARRPAACASVLTPSTPKPISTIPNPSAFHVDLRCGCSHLNRCGVKKGVKIRAENCQERECRSASLHITFAWTTVPIPSLTSVIRWTLHPWFLAAKRILDAAFPGDKRHLRIADLGCLEGGYTVEFARLGLQALGIDVRELNIEACRYVQSKVNLPNLEFARDDVWNIARAWHIRRGVLLRTFLSLGQAARVSQSTVAGDQAPIDPADAFLRSQRLAEFHSAAAISARPGQGLAAQEHRNHHPQAVVS